jgi:hypothetical protein
MESIALNSGDIHVAPALDWVARNLAVDSKCPLVMTPQNTHATTGTAARQAMVGSSRLAPMRELRQIDRLFSPKMLPVFR